MFAMVVPVKTLSGFMLCTSTTELVAQLFYQSPNWVASFDEARRTNKSLACSCWRLLCELQWLFVVVRELLARPECSEERWLVLSKQ